MATEIEHKYHITDNQWKELPVISKVALAQGYIPQDHMNEVRLYVTFPTEDLSMPEIIIVGMYSIEFNVIANDDFHALRALDGYDHDTCELALSGPVVARVRIETDTNGEVKAIFAIKKYMNGGREERAEFEASMRVEDAQEVLENVAIDVIAKERTTILYDGKKWEVDCYSGQHEGFVSADIEVQNVAEFEGMKMLPGAGAEITHDERLSNQFIARFGVPEHLKIAP